MIARLWLVIMSILADIFERTFPTPADPAAPVVSIGKAGLTMAQLRAAADGAPDFMSALIHLVEGHASLADEEVLADDVIAAALALAGPEAAAFATIAPLVANLFLAGLASGAIRPAQNPIADGQSTPPAETHGRWIGR